MARPVSHIRSGDHGSGSGSLGRPETALQHACTQVFTAASDDLVSETLDRMRGKHFESAAAVAVLDNDHLAGVATIERMFGAPEAPHFAT